MPEIKCQQAMIEAIDAMKNPPSTDEEFKKIIDHWRRIEKGEPHNSEVAAHQAIAMINRAEIESILRTRKFREQSATERRAYSSGQGLPMGVGVVSVTTQGRDTTMNFGASTVREWGMARFRSCDIFVPASREYMRFVFYENQVGAFATSWRRPPFLLRCANLIRELNIPRTRYELIPLKPDHSELGFELPAEEAEENGHDDLG